MGSKSTVWREISAYAVCCLISIALHGLGAAIWTYEFKVLGQTNGPQIGTVWLWVFSLPVMASQTPQVGLRDWWPGLLVINPLLYGGMWWFAWRMWKLMRAKRVE